MAQKAGLIAAAVIVIVIIAAAAVYLASQPAPTPTPTPTPTPAPTPTPTPQKLKVAFMLPGSITDAGWNAAMYTAATEVAKELDIDIDISHGLGQVGVDATMRSYAERGYKLIFCWTLGYQDAALRVAPDYKDTWFIGMNWWKTDNLPNIVWQLTPMHEGAYLAGLAASAFTKTGTVAFLDGQKFPMMIATSEGFKAGVERGAQILGKQIKVIRDFVGVWDDVAAGREKALALIDAGADVILFRGDGITLGGIQAASLRGVYAIGDMTDQNALAPKTIITSNIIDCKNVIRYFVNQYRAGTLKAGAHPLGLAQGVEEIAPFHGFDNQVPAAIKAEIERVRAEVKAGTFETDYAGQHWKGIPFITEERAW